MGKKLISSKERKAQRSIAFSFRQLEFFNEYPEFKPDSFCRDAVDEQIAEIDVNYLREGDSRKPNET